ncbi:DUF4212 domain-containing protein [Cupriavidus pauculus]|uniref:DUF4212 domain-containing protein n=1 Tax=Cupriavidus pauculus TaxID=82633 RepID=UPI001CC2DC08|nr:DUF4212 domain-containing protein [Cupriavidus pauculus]
MKRAFPPATAAERRAWRRNLRWIASLLAIWFVVTFVVAWYARELRFAFFGWPFSFWVGAQGALIVYVLMAALYAWRMNRADRTAEPGDARGTDPHPVEPEAGGQGKSARDAA